MCSMISSRVFSSSSSGYTLNSSITRESRPRDRICIEIRCRRLLRSVSDRFDSTSFSEIVCGSISSVAWDEYSFGRIAAMKVATSRPDAATVATRRLLRCRMRLRSSSWTPCSVSMGALSEANGVELPVEPDPEDEVVPLLVFPDVGVLLGAVPVDRREGGRALRELPGRRERDGFRHVL